MQIAAMANTPKLTVNAVRAAAFLLEELEENAINETIRVAFDSQITEFTADMKLLIEDANIKIDEHIKASIEQAKLNAITTQHTVNQNTLPGRNVANSYATALINPPPYVNPKIAAKEGIKARQFLLLGIRESAFGQYDTQKLKAELNKAIRELGCEEGKIRSITTQRDGNILLEVDSDASAKWFANNSNRVELCSILGEEVTFKARIYNVLAHNAPLTMDPDDRNHREEIKETNDLEDGTIVAIRWAKPLNRRSLQQRSAHLVISYSSPEAANRAITNGITICNKKCHVERIRREPLRCLKCQGWNHMAKDCEETHSTCSNCAEHHRTSECQSPRKKRCVSCKSNEHASWSRECPSFQKRVDELNDRNPENLLPFFPTADPWTWSAVSTDDNALPNRYPRYGNDMQNTHQHKGKGREQQRAVDTFIPSYARNLPSWPETMNNELPSHRDDGWWNEQITGIANDAQKHKNPTQTRITSNSSNTPNTQSGQASSSNA
jgi:hypothetical protein